MEEIRRHHTGLLDIQFFSARVSMELMYCMAMTAYLRTISLSKDLAEVLTVGLLQSHHLLSPSPQNSQRNGVLISSKVVFVQVCCQKAFSQAHCSAGSTSSVPA